MASMTTLFHVGPGPDEFVEFHESFGSKAFLQHVWDEQNAPLTHTELARGKLHSARARISKSDPPRIEFPSVRRVHGNKYIYTGRWVSWDKLADLNPLAIAKPPNVRQFVRDGRTVGDERLQALAPGAWLGADEERRQAARKAAALVDAPGPAGVAPVGGSYTSKYAQQAAAASAPIPAHVPAPAHECAHAHAHAHARAAAPAAAAPGAVPVAPSPTPTPACTSAPAIPRPTVTSGRSSYASKYAKHAADAASKAVEEDDDGWFGPGRSTDPIAHTAASPSKPLGAPAPAPASAPAPAPAPVPAAPAPPDPETPVMSPGSTTRSLSLAERLGMPAASPPVPQKALEVPKALAKGTSISSSSRPLASVPAPAAAAATAAVPSIAPTQAPILEPQLPDQPSKEPGPSPPHLDFACTGRSSLNSKHAPIDKLAAKQELADDSAQSIDSILERIRKVRMQVGSNPTSAVPSPAAGHAAAVPMLAHLPDTTGAPACLGGKKSDLVTEASESAPHVHGSESPEHFLAKPLNVDPSPGPRVRNGRPRDVPPSAAKGRRASDTNQPVDSGLKASPPKPKGKEHLPSGFDEHTKDTHGVGTRGRKSWGAKKERQRKERQAAAEQARAAATGGKPCDQPVSAEQPGALQSKAHGGKALEKSAEVKGRKRGQSKTSGVSHSQNGVVSPHHSGPQGGLSVPSEQVKSNQISASSHPTGDAQKLPSPRSNATKTAAVPSAVPAATSIATSLLTLPPGHIDWADEFDDDFDFYSPAPVPKVASGPTVQAKPSNGNSHIRPPSPRATAPAARTPHTLAQHDAHPAHAGGDDRHARSAKRSKKRGGRGAGAEAARLSGSSGAGTGRGVASGLRGSTSSSDVGRRPLESRPGGTPAWFTRPVVHAEAAAAAPAATGVPATTAPPSGHSRGRGRKSRRGEGGKH